MRHIIILLILIFVLSGCKKFLEQHPQDFITPQNYYNNQNEAYSALLGLYSGFTDYNVGLYDAANAGGFNIPTDELFRNSVGGNTNNLIIDATLPSIGNYWNECYKYINNCNSFLENIDKPVMDSSTREVYRAEARFLRAYYYFILTSNFGNIPLKTKSSVDSLVANIVFTPSNEIYNFIITEMTAAEKNVNDVDPTQGQPVRISKQVVRGILARVNLYMAGYPLLLTDHYKDAAYWAKKVIDANENALNPDYHQIWINIAQDAYDLKESMWEAEFTAPAAPYYRASSWIGQTGPGIACPSTNTVVGYTLDWFKVTYTLANLYNTDTIDARKDWNIAPFYYKGNTTWETPRDSLNKTVALIKQKVIDKNPGKGRRKYETVRPATSASGQNFPILRYSDVLLMYAEAQNELNGPADPSTTIDILNLVRQRAHCVNMYSSNSSNSYFLITDKASFRKAIQDERARELCFEFTRRLDLIRWGIYQQTLLNEAQNFINNNYQVTMSTIYNRVTSKNTLLPIPVSEISLNNLAKQNPGW